MSCMVCRGFSTLRAVGPRGYRFFYLTTLWKSQRVQESRVSEPSSADL